MIAFGALTTMVMLRLVGTPMIGSPLAPSSVPLMQLTTPASKWQVKPPGDTVVSSADTNVDPAGSTSRTDTFNAGSEPRFDTARV